MTVKQKNSDPSKLSIVSRESPPIWIRGLIRLDLLLWKLVLSRPFLMLGAFLYGYDLAKGRLH